MAITTTAKDTTPENMEINISLFCSFSVSNDAIRKSLANIQKPTQTEMPKKTPILPCSIPTAANIEIIYNVHSHMEKTVMIAVFINSNMALGSLTSFFLKNSNLHIS